MAGSSVAQAGNLAVSAILASRLLGPHDRGLMVIGATSASIAALVAGLGASHALRARLPTLDDEVARLRLVASYTWLSAATTVLGSVLALLACWACGLAIDAGLAAPAFLAAVLVATLGQIALVQFPDAWYAAGRFRAGSAWAAGIAAGGTVGLVLAAVLLTRTAESLLLGQAAGMTAVAAAQTAHLHSVGLLLLSRPDRRELSRLLRSGVQSLYLTVGLALALRADRYILGGVAGAGVVGVYSTAATLSEAPRVVPAAIGQVTYRQVTLGCGRSDVDRAVLRAVLASLVTGLPVAVAGWFLITPVFGPSFAEAKPLLLVLLVAELLFAPFAVASRGLLGGGWMGTAGRVGAAGMGAAVLLFVLAAREWGAYGAAWASVLLYAGLSGAAVILLRRRVAARRDALSPVGHDAAVGVGAAAGFDEGNVPVPTSPR
ncbi:lipopolysaccharide biosynthesis protein [Micromonospora sp. NPDC047670]|uniref:lipopolysaccharide biosynthesis protein n=1 Tax=Micromonospora sp. NPDC047670 TaxID=3364252 RepID=UPI00371F22DE